MPRRHNYGVSEHPGGKTLNIYKNRLCYFPPCERFVLPTPALKTHFFRCAILKEKKTFQTWAEARGEGERGLGSEYWRATRGVGKRRGSGVGGLTGRPRRPQGKTGGRWAPTRAAPPRSAPSPAWASSSLASTTAFILFPQPSPSSKEHRHNTSFLSPHPLLSGSAPGCPGLPREPPAAPAAAETCAPCSKRGHRR